MVHKCHATTLTFYRSSFHVADVEMAQDEVSAINTSDAYEPTTDFCAPHRSSLVQ